MCFHILSDILSPTFSVFMGGKSTSLQLLKVLDKWTKVLEKGGILHLIYMDFMKAFDKVSHRHRDI